MAMIATLLFPLVRGSEIVLVEIAYAERSDPQGMYVLIKGKDGLFSLAPICAPEKMLPDSKFEEIVTSLEKSYPYLKDRITNATRPRTRGGASSWNPARKFP